MKSFYKNFTSKAAIYTTLGILSLTSLGAVVYSRIDDKHPTSTPVTVEPAHHNESLQEVVVWMMNTPKCKGRPGTELSEVTQKMQARRIDRILTNAGGERRVQEAFILLMCQESQYRANAKSPVGALGIAQLMPATAQAVADQLKLGKLTNDDLYDSEINILLGYTHFKDLVQQYNGNLAKASAAYNGGPAGSTIKAMRNGGIGAAETDAYVRSMFDMQEELRIARVKKNS